MPFFPAPDDGCPGTAVTPGACSQAAHTIRPGTCPDKVLGAEGPRGATGPQGEPGEQGPPGLDGDDGAPGAPGTNGAPGLDGDDGAPGAPGTPGTPGAPGAQGIQGVQGIQGTPGAPGTPGTPGAPGNDGNDGAPGADGADGDTFHGTSSNTFTIPAVGDVVGISTEVGLEFAVGQSVVVVPVAHDIDYFNATITAYNPGTGAISLQVTRSNAIGEEYSSWLITLDGAVGDTGPQGASGQAAGRLFYWDPTNDSDVTGFKTAAEAPPLAGDTVVTVTVSGTGNFLLGSFITEPGSPGVTTFPTGITQRHFHVDTGSANEVARIFIETIICNSDASVQTPFRTAYTPSFSGAMSEVHTDTVQVLSSALLATDRILWKISLARVSGPSSFDASMHFCGTEHTSYQRSTISAGATGPAGPTGATGPPGATGAAGTPGTTARTVMLCGGFTPNAVGEDLIEVTVPHGVAGASVTWTVRRLTLRVKTAGGAPVVVVEKSTAAGIFAPTTVGTLTMPSGDYEVDNTTSLGTVATGNKLRFSVTTLATAQYWTITVEIDE